MSKTVDSRIVEMQFDNKDFEKNINTSISSLDNLDKQLKNLEGVKGLEEMGKAAKKLNLEEAGEQVTGLGEKFSMLEQLAIGSLRRIADHVTDLGLHLVKSLTIDQVTAGFNEYETKMTSVQTMMNSTGESIDVVKDHLEQLNEYADKTIYSFSDMTSNIGKFTNAGVDLTTATEAIKGISNWAALAGANANEASRAMYNISQSMSGGYMQLIDWKSVKFANMATQTVLKNLADTAEVMGTIKKNADGTYDTLTRNMQGKVAEGLNLQQLFNEGLNYQWLSTDVLMETMDHFSKDITKMTEVEKQAYETKLTGLGYTAEQIQQIEELGIQANKAATEVKTFSMLLDTLAEAVGSGWAMTFEYIFGDLEQAKVLWTGISDELGGIINKVSDWRNGVLKEWGEAGGRSAIIEGFKNLWKAFKDFVAPIGQAFREVFNGDAVNTLLEMSFRFKDFTKNLKVSSGLADGMKGIFKALFTSIKAIGNGIKVVWTVAQPLIKFGAKILEIAIRLAGSLGNLISGIFGVGEASDALLDGIVGIEARVVAIAEPLEDFINNLQFIFDAGWADRESGIFAIFNTLFEVVKATVSFIIGSVSAITGIDLTGFENNVIGAMNAVRDEVRLRIMEISDFISGIFEKIHFDGSFFDKILSFVTDSNFRSQAIDAGMNMVLGLVQGIKNGIASVIPECILNLYHSIHDYFCELFRIESPSKVMSGLGFYIVEGLAVGIVMALRPFLIPAVKEIGTKIVDAFQNGEGFTKVADIGKQIVAGIGEGMRSAIAMIPNPVLEVVNAIIDKFCEFFGIESPSKVMAAVVGSMLISGIALGMVESTGALDPAIENLKSIYASLEPVLSPLINVVKTVFDAVLYFAKAVKTVVVDLWKFLDQFKIGEKLGAYLSALTPEQTIELLQRILVIGTLIFSIVSILKTFSTATDLAGKIVKPIEAIGKALGSIGELANAIKADIKTRAIRALFRDIAIVLVSVMASIYILGKMMNADELTRGGTIALAILAVLGVITVALVGITAKMQMSVEALKKISSLSKMFVGIGASLFLIAMAVKKIASIPMENLDQAKWVLIGIATFYTVLVGVILVVTSYFGPYGLNTVWKALLGAAGSVYLVAMAIEKVAYIPREGLAQACLIVGGILLFIGILTVFIIESSKMNTAYQTSMGFAGLGAALIGLGICVNLITTAVRHMAALYSKDVWSFLAGLGAIGLIIAALGAVMEKAGRMPRAWKSLLSLAVLFGVMGMVIKVVGSMTGPEIAKGIAGLLAIEVFAIALMAVTGFINKKFSNDENANIAKNLIGAAISIGIMALVVKLIGDIPNPRKALDILGEITGLMAALIFVVGLANAMSGKVSSSSKGSWKGLKKGNFESTKESSAGPGFAQLIGIAVSIAILGYTCAQLAKIPEKDLDAAMVVMIVIAGIMAALILITGYVGKLEGIKMSSLISIAVTVAAVAASLALLSVFADQWPGMLAGAVGMALIIAAVGAMFAGLSKIPEISTKQTISILLVITALTIIMAALGLIAVNSKDIDWKPLIGFGASMCLMLVGLGAALKLAKGLDVKDAFAIVVASAAIAVAGLGLSLIGQYDWKTITFGVVGMAAAFTVMALAMNMMGQLNVKELVISIVALGAATAALYFVAQGMSQIAMYDWNNISAAMKGMLIALGVASAILAVLGLFKTVGIIGAILLLAVASSLLITSIAMEKGAKAIQVFSNAMQDFLSSETAQGFINFFVELGKGIPVATAAITTGLMMGIATLTAAAPLITTALDLLVRAVAKGILSLADTVEKKGVEVIKRVSKLVDTLKKTVEDEFGIKSPSKYFAIIGEFLMRGLANGIMAGITAPLGPVSAVITAASEIIKAIKNKFQVKSPSIIFKLIGGFLMTGLANGIVENMTKPKEAAVDAGEGIEEGVLDGAKNILSGETAKKLTDALGIEIPEGISFEELSKLTDLTKVDWSKIDLSSMTDLDSESLMKYVEGLKDANSEASQLNETLTDIQNKDETVTIDVKLDESGIKSETDKVLKGVYGNGLARWKKMYETYLKSYNGDSAKALAAVVQIQNDINKQLGSKVTHTADEMAKRLGTVVKDVKDATKEAEKAIKDVKYGTDEYYKQNAEHGKTVNTKRNNSYAKYGTDAYEKQKKGITINNKLSEEALAPLESLIDDARDFSYMSQIETTTANITKESQEWLKTQYKILRNKDLLISAEERNLAMLRLRYIEEQLADEGITKEKRDQLVYLQNHYSKIVDIYNKQQDMRDIMEINVEEQKKLTEAAKETAKAVEYGSAEYEKQKSGTTINNRKTISNVEAKVSAAKVDTTEYGKSVNEALDKENKNINSLLEIKPKVVTVDAEKNVESFMNKTNKMATTIPKNFEGVNTGISTYMNSVNKTMETSGKKVEENGTKTFNNAVNNAAKTVSSAQNVAKFNNAGKMMGSGIVAGMASKIADIVKMGKNFATAAYNSTRTTLKIASPSKLYEQIGIYTGEGQVNGMMSMLTSIYSAGDAMANAAIDGVADNIDAISMAMNNVDMTVEPRIVPVVDPSNIQGNLGDVNNLVGQYRVNDIEANMNWNRTFESEKLAAMQTQLNDMKTAFSNLANILINQPTPEVNANVILQGDANGVFNLVRQENVRYKKMYGTSGI